MQSMFTTGKKAVYIGKGARLRRAQEDFVLKLKYTTDFRHCIYKEEIRYLYDPIEQKMNIFMLVNVWYDKK